MPTDLAGEEISRPIVAGGLTSLPIGVAVGPVESVGERLAVFRDAEGRASFVVRIQPTCQPPTIWPVTPWLLKIRLPGTDRQLIGSAHLEGLRFIGAETAHSGFWLYLLSRCGKAAEAAAGVIPQPGEGISRQEGQAIGEAFLYLQLQALVVRRAGASKLLKMFEYCG